jgi:hypothetical protein
MVPEWMSSALCATFPHLLWIAEPENTSDAARASMRLICGLCPVAAECRSSVEETSVVSGFWAGRDRTPQLQAEMTEGAA